MKKAIKKLTALFLVTVALLSSAIIVGADEQEITVDSPSMLQEDSINQYNLMLMAFKHAGTTRNATYSDISYPDYYAGGYINEDNDLVVKVTKDNLDKASTIREMTRSNDTVIESATYSYNELTELKDSIWNKYLALYAEYENRVDEIDADLFSILTSFVGLGIRQETNTIIVDLKCIDDQTISSFKKYFANNENIEFELCNEVKTQALPIYSGDMITTSDGYMGSIGFRSKMYIADEDRYAQGFFTAYHVFGFPAVQDTPVTYTQAHTSNNQVANVYYNFGYLCDGVIGGTLDAAFVEIENDYEMIAQTSLGVSLGDNYFTAVAEGGYVTMCGKTSQDALTGKVKDTSYSVTVEIDETKFNISDTYRCDYAGQGGDSGGVVYKETGGSNCIVGIHAGKLGFLQGNDSYVIKASNIYAYWNLYLY